jgi:hypothetical protein
MNGGTCLHETPGKRLPRGRKKNVRCDRSSLLTNSLPYKEGQAPFAPAPQCSKAPSWFNPVIQSSVCQVRMIFPSLNSWMSTAWMLKRRP